MFFVGIDLAWQSNRNPTGAAALVGDQSGAELHSIAPPLRSYAEVQELLAQYDDRPAFVAIDAPLVVPNLTGLRQCEREVGRRYGSRHASCHASNLSLYPDPLSVRLAEWLEGQGYQHAPASVGERTMLEVYPHAAFVALFDLPRIIRYKKGRVAEKVTGLGVVQHTIRALSGEASPLRLTPELDRFLSLDVAGLRGSRRKEYEDSIDAVFCAYLAYFFWRWGFDRSEVFGTREDGYIINPKLQTWDGVVQ